jgi:hypothetical protein
VVPSDVKLWKLSSGSDDSFGLSCTEEGLFLGRTALVERHGERYAARSQTELERLLMRAYGGDVAADRVMPGIRVVAAALGERNLCLAQIAAVHLRMPDLPGKIARCSLEDEDRLLKARRGEDRLARGGWDPAEHPRAGVPPNPGWFAPTDGGQAPTQTAHGEEDERAPEDMLDPNVPLRQAQWDTAIATLRAIDPDNAQLSSLTAPGWVPSNQDIALINQEIGMAVTRRVTDFVMPSGHPIGRQGGNVDVRVLQGGAKAAQKAFDYLSVGGTSLTGDYPGTLVKLPGDAGFVGLLTNSQGIPTVDLNLPSAFGVLRLHYQ